MTKQPSQSVETQVALLNQFNTEVVKPFIEESTKTQKDIANSIKNLDYVSRSEYDSDQKNIDKRFRKLESRDNVKQTLLWMGLVASAIINIVVIYQLFTGE